jgi:hypothetical protein
MIDDQSPEVSAAFRIVATAGSRPLRLEYFDVATQYDHLAMRPAIPMIPGNRSALMDLNARS